MTLGKKIQVSRKEAGITSADLATMIGVSSSTMSYIEKDAYKKGLSPELLIKISDALNDPSILSHALLLNPICKRIIPRAFEPLNNIKTETSAMLEKLREELSEALDAVDILARNFTHKDPASQPMFREVLFAKLEQLMDVQRCNEELFGHLKGIGILSAADELEIHLRQQAKVVRHGHHKPEIQEAV